MFLIPDLLLFVSGMGRFFYPDRNQKTKGSGVNISTAQVLVPWNLL